MCEGGGGEGMHRYPALFELPAGFLSTKETLVASVSTSHSHCLISQLEKEVKLQGVVSTILTNGVLNLAGMGATILGLQVPAWHGSVPWCLGKGSCLYITGTLLARHVFCCFMPWPSHDTQSSRSWSTLPPTPGIHRWPGGQDTDLRFCGWVCIPGPRAPSRCAGCLFDPGGPWCARAWAVIYGRAVPAAASMPPLYLLTRADSYS